jgi:adenine C2-methylase RlmN of 23S rRNA A2503 and tRNA A37
MDNLTKQVLDNRTQEYVDKAEQMLNLHREISARLKRQAKLKRTLLDR